MTATDAQVRRMMKERSNGKSRQQAAVKVNLHSRRTVQKHEQLGQLPGWMKEPRFDPRRHRLRPSIPQRDGSALDPAG